MSDHVDVVAYATGGGLWERVTALRPESQTAFALLCAERLIQNAPDEAQAIDAALRGVQAGWQASKIGAEGVSALRLELNERDDIDDDYLAATAYPLDAVLGNTPAPTVCAASRAIDRAFSLEAEDHVEVTFRPLAKDAKSARVQAEVDWQIEAINRLGAHGPTEAVLAELRAIS